MPLDDDVLQQIAETGLDRALVAGIDLEIVGNRTLLSDVAVGLYQHHACGVAELGAARRDLLQRGQAGFVRGELLLAAAHVPRAQFVLAALPAPPRSLVWSQSPRRGHHPGVGVLVRFGGHRARLAPDRHG